MAIEKKVAVGSNEFYITEESTTGIPPRVTGLAGVSHHSNNIVLTILQVVGHVKLETHIAIVGAANLSAVDIDITHIHDATEVEY